MDNQELKKLKYDEIKIGDTSSFIHKITLEDIEKFIEISGDTNPLHCNEEYAKTTEFKGRIVHGMLVSSLLSQLVGMHLPGKYCLYLSQTLEFRKPIRPNTVLKIVGEVISKMDAFKLLTIRTTVSDDKTDTTYITGEAKVRVLK